MINTHTKFYQRFLLILYFSYPDYASIKQSFKEVLYHLIVVVQANTASRLSQGRI